MVSETKGSTYGDYMDPFAPLTVAKGTVITCKSVLSIVILPPSHSNSISLIAFASSAIGASYGLIKRLPVGLLATSAAMNGGIASATFLSFREYCISPLLIYTLSSANYIRRRHQLGILSDTAPIPGALSYSEMRTNRLLDSNISGALTGALLNSWKRGRPGVIPGFVAGGLICTILQWAGNEAEVARVRYVANKLKQPEPSTPIPATPVVTPTSKPDVDSVSQKSWTDRVLDRLGFERMSDEQYLKKLKSTREAHLARIRELEQELEEQQNEPTEKRS